MAQQRLITYRTLENKNMQKEITNQVLAQEAPIAPDWLDLEQLARVELTSEDEENPFEAALTALAGAGWRASRPGEQTIRLLFHKPQTINQIQLLFREETQARAQEFLLRWLPAGEETYQEIVRQQYNFSPPHTTTQVEVYTVALNQVRALELSINPDQTNHGAYATLAQLRLA
jgi:hypothetical protein